MRISKLFIDDYGLLRSGWLVAIPFAIIIAIVGIIIWIGAALSAPGGQYSNFTARCESANGISGSNKCYRNGEMLFKMGDGE